MSFCCQFALRVTSPSHESASVCTCTLLCIPLLHFTTMKMPQCALCPITLLRIKSSVCTFVVSFESFRKEDSYILQNTGWNPWLFRFRLSIVIQTTHATGTCQNSSWQRLQPTTTLSAGWVVLDDGWMDGWMLHELIPTKWFDWTRGIP